jgi:hypothetical protein
MSTFLISQFEPPKWSGDIYFKIIPEKYSNGLKILWPDITITTPSSTEYSLWWELEREDKYPIMGGLQIDHNVVSVDGSYEYVAEFAIWHRTFIPQEYKLYFFHESLEVLFELKPSVSVSEVLTRMSKK